MLDNEPERIIFSKPHNNFEKIQNSYLAGIEGLNSKPL